MHLQVKLSVFEARVEETIDNTRYIPVTLAQVGVPFYVDCISVLVVVTKWVGGGKGTA